MITIQIERLTTGTWIHRTGGDFNQGGFAEVQSIEFDDGIYTVTALFIETNGAQDWAGDEQVVFTVDAGQSIEFGGVREPKLRAETDVSFEEWQVKAVALGEALDETLAAAVADALSVPALGMAAE